MTDRDDCRVHPGTPAETVGETGRFASQTELGGCRLRSQRLPAIDRDDSLQSSRAVYSSYLHANDVDVKSAFTGIPCRTNVDSAVW